MKKNSSSFRNSGAYTSPSTPEYGEIPKGWSSERVPLPVNNTSKRHIGLIPFNSGKALPSKWDDAERWITSPVSGYNNNNNNNNNSFKNSIAQPQRRQKSKSGPLGPPGLGYFSNYSPNMEIENVNFMGNSPLMAGVLVPDGLSIRYDGENNNKNRSTSVPGLLDFVSEGSFQDDKFDGTKEEDALVSRRDMATQMSPEGSTHSSAKGRLSFSILPSASNPNSSVNDEVKDVQVDKGAIRDRRKSKKLGTRKMKDLTIVEDDAPSPYVAEASKKMLKLQREEAKITVWENLQKAKTEAAIQKLETKLEKKRSISMDKILKKLGAAQMKAQTMRNSLSENHGHGNREISRSKGISCCKLVKMPSLSCFITHRN